LDVQDLPDLDLRRAVVGVDELVPVLGGFAPYVNLDNAASTPPFRFVAETVQRFLPYYASVHRGSGYKSRVSTEAYEQARACIREFVGADAERDVAVFGKNTTEAINVLARSLRAPANSIVITTALEHHSNDLPWRARGRTAVVRALADGSLDEGHLDELLAQHAGRIALLAVTGASNVTGVVPPIHTLAEKVHAVGGYIAVDAAQLAGHRAIDMRPHDDPKHLDFVALSAHKMYAPFGTGALIGRRDAFAPTPDHVGGGTVVAVTADDVAWADLPDRGEAGSPNVLGAIALAAAALVLENFGWDRITAHEGELTRYALARLPLVRGLTIHGPQTLDGANKVGVVPFSVEGFHHDRIASALADDHGIGVRSGCFCAHPYLAHLLRFSTADARRAFERLREGETRSSPGLVRMSLGCYNDVADLERAIDALEQITAEAVTASA
jgi:selenocysteine lyase/cysteine desulfurase